MTRIRTAFAAISISVVIAILFISVPGALEVRAAAPAFAPCCLQLSVASSTEIDLSWTGIDVANSAITGYMIERESPTGSGFSTVIANSNSTASTYSDTNLSPGTTYNYRISEINSAGVSPPSTSASATTLPIPVTTLPGAPQNLVAAPISASEIDLSWTAPANTAISGYRVERETPIGAGFYTIINTTSTATSYSDVNLSPGVIFNYRVFAISNYGPSVPSASAYAMTFMQPGAPRGAVAAAGNSQVIVNWQPPFYTGGGISGYTISTVSSTSTPITTLSNVTSTVITGLVNGTPYYFSVSAFNPAGTSSAAITNTVTPSATITTTAPPALSVITSSTPTVSSPAAHTFIFVYLLGVGSRGNAVQELQKRLIVEGFYSGPVTGYFGQLTKAAVVRYQKAHGIMTTGMLGPITRASLNSGH